MKIWFFIIIMVYSSVLLTENIAFPDSIYSSTDFLNGVEIKNPQVSLFPDTIYTFPGNKPVNLDSVFCNHKHYLVAMYSPYICSACYHANFNILNNIAQKYPQQVILLIEYWNLRDVKKGLESLEINNNIKIFLDKDGRNIFKISTLDDEFINTGFVVIDNNLKINYILMASFLHPYTDKKLKALASAVESYLKK